MAPDDIIESYVSDVVRRLPARQRQDVGLELRSLLREELTGREADLGRDADEPMVMDLLAAFGRPQDVADRYRPAGFTVIRPADAPRFAWVALGGVALQWALTLPVVLGGTSEPAGVGDAAGSEHWLTRLSAWWLSWGLGSFWWPGFLISVLLVVALVRHRRPGAGVGTTDPEWHPQERSGTVRRSVLDPDRVGRPGLALAIGFWALGASVLIALPWLPRLAPGLPEPLLAAFELDPDFLRVRAPWVLALWLASFAVQVAVLLAGRTRRLTRRLSLAVGVGWLALLTWCLTAGPVFTSTAADGVVRFWLVVVMVIVVVDLVATARRAMVPTSAPSLAASRQ